MAFFHNYYIHDNIELINAYDAIKTDRDAVIRQYDEWDNNKEI